MFRRSFAPALALLAACGGARPSATEAPPPTATPVAPTVVAPAAADASPPTPIADAYREQAAAIVAEGLKTQGAYKRLAYLTDHIGHRLAGSPQLDAAIVWAADEMKRDGLEVRTEKVMVRHWVRGAEAGEIVTPVKRPLHLLALGGSAGTGKKGLRAPVVIVSGLEELKQLGEDGVKGKIVLFNQVMPPPDPETGNPHYGESSSSRFVGPRAASKLGASAALVRSVTARSLSSPHTGMTSFGKEKRIPAAAITTEDADLIVRLAAEGPVELRLVLGAKLLPDAESANVIGELRGREHPEQVVVIGAHLDSWDVGQGAHDDGAGCVIVMEALSIIKRLGLQPRRTIRVVLYTNEENGAEGADAYAEDHAAELSDHVAAIESDTGSFKPMGFMLDAEAAERQGLGPEVLAQLADIVTLLAPFDAARAIMGFGGTDIDPIGQAKGNKTPMIGHWVDMRTYFDYHHTEADTLDKVDAKILQDNAVVMAIVAYVIADMPARLGE